MTVNLVTFLLIEGIIALGIIVWRLMKKIERQEEIILKQDETIQAIKVVVGLSNDRLEEIDSKGTFESDDEVGWFFQNLKNIQQELNQLTKHGF